MYVGKFVVAERGTEKNGRMEHGGAKNNGYTLKAEAEDPISANGDLINQCEKSLRV